MGKIIYLLKYVLNMIGYDLQTGTTHFDFWQPLVQHIWLPGQSPSPEHSSKQELLSTWRTTGHIPFLQRPETNNQLLYFSEKCVYPNISI